MTAAEGAAVTESLRRTLATWRGEWSWAIRCSPRREEFITSVQR